jgi:organic hydroperoxide reductase OsmC/OhrA
MSTPFPHRYSVGLLWDGDEGGSISSGERPPIRGGAPPEFDGRASWWSPEHLLLSSIGLCLMTTFQAYLRRAGLDLAAYESRGEAVLNKVPGGLGFTSITLHVRVKVASDDVEQARGLLVKAKSQCIVANALMAPVHLDAVVEADVLAERPALVGN